MINSGQSFCITTINYCSGHTSYQHLMIYLIELALCSKCMCANRFMIPQYTPIHPGMETMKAHAGTGRCLESVQIEPASLKQTLRPPSWTFLHCSFPVLYWNTNLRTGCPWKPSRVIRNPELRADLRAAGMTPCCSYLVPQEEVRTREDASPGSGLLAVLLLHAKAFCLWNVSILKFSCLCSFCIQRF